MIVIVAAFAIAAIPLAFLLYAVERVTGICHRCGQPMSLWAWQTSKAGAWWHPSCR